MIQKVGQQRKQQPGLRWISERSSVGKNKSPFAAIDSPSITMVHSVFVRIIIEIYFLSRWTMIRGIHDTPTEVAALDYAASASPLQERATAFSLPKIIVRG
jgi:hypothetical protein